jgi:hypothetical protein
LLAALDVADLPAPHRTSAGAIAARSGHSTKKDASGSLCSATYCMSSRCAAPPTVKE